MIRLCLTVLALMLFTALVLARVFSGVAVVPIARAELNGVRGGADCAQSHLAFCDATLCQDIECDQMTQKCPDNTQSHNIINVNYYTCDMGNASGKSWCDYDTLQECSYVKYCKAGAGNCRMNMNGVWVCQDDPNDLRPAEIQYANGIDIGIARGDDCPPP